MLSSTKEQIALYFGSFNPIHNGHIEIAQKILNAFSFDALWFVVSPNNPFKQTKDLLPETERLKMVSLAIESYPKMVVSDVEFDMMRPSYTYNTLQKLKDCYPEKTFSIIMGSDNAERIEQWKNYQEIIDNYSIYVYPRGENKVKKTQKNFIYLSFSLLDVSSSDIRTKLKEGVSVADLLPKKVFQFIKENHLYNIND